MKEGRLGGWRMVAVMEAAALMISLVMPATPSRTGTRWSPAEFVWPDPSYLQQVSVWFVITNGVALLMGGLLVLWVRMEGGAGDG